MCLISLRNGGNGPHMAWCLLVLSVVTLADGAAHPARVVLLSVSETDARVERSRSTMDLVDPHRDHRVAQRKVRTLDSIADRTGDPEGWDVSYTLDGTTFHVHRNHDPRPLIGDWFEDDKPKGQRIIRERGHFVVTIPQAATHLHVQHTHARERVHVLHVPRNDTHPNKYHTLVTAGNEPKLLQQPKLLPSGIGAGQLVGKMDEHKNIVFLSAGYTVNEEGKFTRDVSLMIEFLQLETAGGEKTGRSADPWKRYFSLLNIFALFSPDAQSGVSHPTFQGGDIRENQMGCTYGITQKRFLQCDDSLVKWLGSYAPPRDAHSVYVVVVNDPEYGGSGGGGVAVISNLIPEKDTTMLSLLTHEMGHADGGLIDEYDYEFDEPAHIKGLANCHYSQAVEVPWQGWINDGVLAAPVRSCSYSNYYKPTNQECQMFSNSRKPAFCAACLEAMTLGLYRDIVELTSPRCPVHDERIYVEMNDTVTMALNGLLLKEPNVRQPDMWLVGPGVNHSLDHKYWRTEKDAQGNPTLEVITFKVRELLPTLGNYTILVRLIDEVPWVRQENRAPGMDFETEFLLAVVDDVTRSGCVFKHEHCGNLDISVCSICESDLSCNITYDAAPLELHGIPGVVAEVENFLSSMAIALGGGFGVFVALFCCCGQVFKNRKADIVRQAKIIKYMRNTMMFASCVIMLCALGVMGYGMYLYQSFDTFGKSLDFAMMGAAVVIYIIAFVGFVAGFFRSRALMAVNGVLLVILMATVIYATVVTYKIGSTIRDDRWKLLIEDSWLEFVQTHPAEVCSLQKLLKCSGFIHGCHNVVVNSYCPVNCARQNRNVEPCYEFLIQKIEDNFFIVFKCGIALSLLHAVSVLFNWVYCCTIERKDVTAAKRRAKMPQNDTEMGLLGSKGGAPVRSPRMASRPLRTAPSGPRQSVINNQQPQTPYQPMTTPQ